MDEQIIDFVRENPFIYNKSHPSYKNIYLRDKQFAVLAQQLNEPVKKVKERWRSLRDRYYKHKKKLPSGSGASTSKEWKYTSTMSFLNDVDKENQNTCSNFEEDSINYITLNESSSEMHNSLDAYEPPKKKTTTERADVRLSQMQSDLSGLVSVAKEAIGGTSQKNTAMQYFFKSLADQAESLNLNVTEAANMQIDLLNVLKNYDKTYN